MNELNVSSFRSRIENGEQLIGTILTLTDPSIAEILAQSGFDWLWIDCEHTSLDIGTVQSLVQAAGGCPCIVRVPTLDESWVKKTLDAGVEGVIFPLVNQSTQAERAVSLTKYPPLGLRSLGMGRAQGYGTKVNDYLRTANERICTIIQIEHYLGVQNLDSILQVPGIDAVLIGPYDLSASMGKPGLVDDPEVFSTIEFIRQSCVSAGKPVGIFAGNSSRACRAVENRFNFVGVSVDVIMLIESANHLLQTVRAAVPSISPDQE